jgi:fructokinase
MRIFAIGEALIDFMPEGSGFIPVVGGAPANVTACAAKLGRKAYFIGKVGADLFGKKIREELGAAGVNMDYLHFTKRANTALSFVTLKKGGEREFAFYRKPSADMFLSPKEINKIQFEASDILHFCSVDLIDKPVKAATVAAIKKLKAAGGLISFDPNIRKSLWDDHEKYKKTVNGFLGYADVIKLSGDECDFIFGHSDFDKIAKELLESAKIVLFTFGGEGSRCYYADSVFDQAAYPVKCVDTTGAGDSFIGTFLSFLDLSAIPFSIPSALNYASACSALVCSKKGVLTSLPTLKALKNFMSKSNAEK